MTRPPTRCAHCPVGGLTYCCALPEEDLKALDRVAVHRRLAEGTVLAQSGGDNPYCAHLLSGMVKLQIVSPEGREQTVAILKPGDFFGQLFEEESRLTATAAGPTDLCLYSRPALEQLATRRPAIMRALLSAISASLEGARDRQISFAQKSAVARLAEFLVDQPVEGATVTIPISRTDLANYLGMPIETLSRQFSKLKRDGVISFEPGSKSIAVNRQETLERVAQGRG